MAPRRHLVVDVTITSARAKTNTPHIGIRLPLRCSHTLGALRDKLDADLRTSTLLGTPSVQSAHDYYPFALEDGYRLAPMAAELVDSMAILVTIRRFPSIAFGNYVCMHTLVRRYTCVPYDDFWGKYVSIRGVNAGNIFLLLSVVLWVLVFAMLYRRAVLMLWHVSLFLGLLGLWDFTLFIFPFLVCGFHCFF
jgi:hypothetical protein